MDKHKKVRLKRSNQIHQLRSTYSSISFKVFIIIMVTISGINCIHEDPEIDKLHPHDEED